MLSPVCIEASALEQTLRVQKIVEEHNGSDFVFADTPNEKEELWKVWTCNYFTGNLTWYQFDKLYDEELSFENVL